MSSCDTFVALPPATSGCIIFGKNSDRPPSEIQEVIHVKAEDHGNGSKVQCTYIEIEQASHTYAVILSKPAWMWGAEMGANEHGVCIGNEAIYTKMASDEDKEEKLLGMDLVRLGLERAKTAREAVDVITELLVTYGQGGPCYDDPSKADVIYHNSFLIVDGTEAWVLETAGKEWAAERLTSGTKNLTNLMSIKTNYELSSPGLKETAKSKGFWSGEGELDFTEVYSSDISSVKTCPGSEDPTIRLKAGQELMKKYAEGGFTTSSMMSILRDEESGICRLGATGSATMGSQVSVLYPPASGKPSCHWFTATPNPARSVFKPFVFTPEASIPSLTVSPTYPDDPAKTKPRFQRKVDRCHTLYAAHQKINPLDDNFQQESLRNLLMGLESDCVKEMEEFLADYDSSRVSELEGLFGDAVETELKFYQKYIK